MSSLGATEKLYLEKLLGMARGYVLDFSDATFEEFFARHNVDIHGARYQRHGTSKAKKMRAFWEIEPDPLVAQVLTEMLALYEALCNLGDRERDSVSLNKCREIVGRLSGDIADSSSREEAGFLSEDFVIPDLHKLPVDPLASGIIRNRLEEAQSCLRVGAHLSVIFQCGSVLEAVLLGAAQRNPRKFNQSASSPKQRDGKVKPFPEWTLSELINAAHDIGLLKADVQKFSHGLRDFRNYIHPYEQMVSKFSPDKHTATVCLQVLKAALADVSGER